MQTENVPVGELGRRIGSGREADVFAYGTGEVVKLLHAGHDPARADVEAAVLRTLEAAGYDAPRPRGVVTVDGRRGLVMTRVDGVDLFAALARNPLLLIRIGRVLATRQADLHDIVAPAELPALADVLRSRIAAAVPLPDDLRDQALELLAGLDDGDRLCHGDLHPGNLVGPPRDPTVIDWAGATRGPPTADVARTQLLLREGVVPEDAPRLLRVLAPRLRAVLAACHLWCIRRRRPVDSADFDRWTVVWAAARLAEGIEAEYPVMLQRLRARFG